MNIIAVTFTVITATQKREKASQEVVCMTTAMLLSEPVVAVCIAVMCNY